MDFLWNGLNVVWPIILYAILSNRRENGAENLEMERQVKNETFQAKVEQSMRNRGHYLKKKSKLSFFIHYAKCFVSFIV